MFDIDKIVEYYEYSNSFDNCGYILKDGRILKYKKDSTILEHYQVEKFYKLNKCDCREINGKPECQHKYDCRYSVRNYFMMMGNIRCIGDMGMFHIVSNNINWDVLLKYIEHHLFYNNIKVSADYQKINIKNNYIRLECVKNMIFEKDNYLEKLQLLKVFYE